MLLTHAWLMSAQPPSSAHTCLAGHRASCPPSRYAGDAEGRGGIYNFVTKRGLCHGNNSKISWTQVRQPAPWG